MTAKPLRAVLYARVSTDDGQQNTETQFQALRELCARRGYEVVERFSDRVTGDPQRRGADPPGLCSALKALERRQAEVLVIFAADRLVRSAIGLLQLVDRIRNTLQAHLVSYTEGDELDTTTDSGQLSTFLRGWFAHQQMRLGRARTIAGLQRARAEGKILGRRAEPLPAVDAVMPLRARGFGEQRIADALGVPRCRVRRVLPQVDRELAAQAVNKPGGRSTNGGLEEDRQPEEKGAGENVG